MPTFSSPAIEINMHRIPGLSNRFIYSNDDFFLMRPICPVKFWIFFLYESFKILPTFTSLQAQSLKFFLKLIKDIFITSKDELILYPKEGKEHRTAYGARKKYKYKCECPKEKMGNGKCDNNPTCNKFECFWDGHDCDDILPLSAYYIDKRASYHQRHRFKVRVSKMNGLQNERSILKYPESGQRVESESHVVVKWPPGLA